MGRVSVNLGNLKQLAEKLRETDRKKLQVGWFESAKYDDGLPVATVMMMNEFGTKTAPPRPVLRPTAAENKAHWKAMFADGAQAFVSGSLPYSSVLEAVGATAASDIQTYIARANFAPLSPITIALRGLKNKGYQVGGKLVGKVAGAIADGKTGPGQLGDQSFGNKDPLRDTGFAVASVNWLVSDGN